MVHLKYRRKDKILKFYQKTYLAEIIMTGDDTVHGKGQVISLVGCLLRED